MIDRMLMGASERGYRPEEIRDAVINELAPYFDYKDFLNKFASESQMLSMFEYFIRYHYDKAFADGVKDVLNCYKQAFLKDKNGFWNIVLCSYEQMVNDENKMWSVRNKNARTLNSELYEKVIYYMRLVGDNLEITAKHIVQELYALILMSDNKVLDYPKIRKMDFGVIINNIIEQKFLLKELITTPFQMKLSDWRNIAYHHSYSISNNKINCSYGKKIVKNISIDLNELEDCVHQIIRTCNVFTIARCIFIFDYNHEIPTSYILEKVDFREPMLIDQLRIALLAQEFNLCNIQDDKQKIEVDFVDSLANANGKERIVHCSQLLYRVWKVWKRQEVVINYISTDGKKVCKLSIKGNVCEAVSKGEKDMMCLAEQFEIVYNE